jgi:hypothetical protein
MPWTFAHPAIVVPLLQLCGSNARISQWLRPWQASIGMGLVLGSMAPDLPYYGVWQPTQALSHSVQGANALALVYGLLAWLCLSFGARFWTAPLSGRAHALWLSWLWGARWDFRLRSLIVVSTALLLGAHSHLLWDSFTHRNGFAVVYFSVLQRDWMGVPAYRVLQYGCSGLGVLYIGFVFHRALARRPEAPSSLHRTLLGALLLLLMAAIALGFVRALAHPEYFWRVFGFTAAVLSAQLCVLAWLLACVYYRLVCRVALARHL